MHLDGPSLSLSATDLANFLGCRHRTALEMEYAQGLRKKPSFDDPLLELLFKRGEDHERAYVQTLVDAGHTVENLTHLKRPNLRDEHLARTIDAMRNGTDVIVQGALRLGPWFGMPDILRRLPTRSAFGEWSYEIYDTKLAREARAGAVLQLVLYSRMLTDVQGGEPARFHVVTPGEHQPFAVHSFRLSEYASYVRLIEEQLTATVAQPAAEVAQANYPEPVDHCHICPWSGVCRDKRHADDHLSLVAGITRAQRRELELAGTTTLTQLAQRSESFTPRRGSAESFELVRAQARIQFESRDKAPPLYERREIKKRDLSELERRDQPPEVDEPKGLARLPAPSPGDLFLDLEGDNLAVEGGREYLFGLVSLGPNGEPEYTPIWASNAQEERDAFERVIRRIVENIERYPDMHVFHYAPYETTAFKRLMTRYVTCEDELDGMLRAGRFVDLYAVVRQGLIAGVERYSIKNLEALYGFTRKVPLDQASKALRVFEYALATNALPLLPQDVRDVVAGYNEDDCVSTLRLYEWLESVRAQAIADGVDIPRPVLGDSNPSEEQSEKQRRVAELRERLTDPKQSVPPEDPVEHGRWLLAYLIDFHTRENKSNWWRFYDLRGATDDKLLRESDAIAGLTFVRRIDTPRYKNGNPRGPVVDRYEYPQQEMEIRKGANLRIRETNDDFGEVVAVDRNARTIDIRKGKKSAEIHPTAVFEFDQVPLKPLEPTLFALGEAVAAQPGLDGANAIARTLLLREPPRLVAGQFAQPAHASASDFAEGVVHHLANTVLPIQGPPGAGKTYTGAKMIRALVANGKRVGVMGPSHKVISNLLKAVADQAASSPRIVRLAQKASENDAGEDESESIALVESNEEARDQIKNGEIDVLGGTAWLWSRPDMANSVDVLFVDEAGQVSLANATAASAAATNMVLLGDPQQLDQPQKGSHPEGVAASVLQHILGEHETIPRHRGIFLPVTWRLAPAICKFTSEIFYENRLEWKPGLDHQAIVGVDGLTGSGLWTVDVDHEGCTSASDREVEVVAELVKRLTAPGASWISEEQEVEQLGLKHILIVSPFNAQVSRLIEKLPSGARVGTVDKFQGQEAPVVIYSMATSRPEDAPRGMEFLYSLNRFNVATSRAKCAAIVVASRRLYEPECRSPRQMRLANALCRYRELARELQVPFTMK